MGAFIDTDPLTGTEKITETFTCPHHNTIHPLYDEAGRRLDVMMCRKCMKPVCDKCVVIESSGGNMCVHIEKRLDEYEKAFRQAVDRQLARHHLLKQFGLTTLSCLILALACAACTPAPAPAPAPYAPAQPESTVTPHRLGFSTDGGGVQMVTTSTTRQIFVVDVQTNPFDNSADIGYVCWLTAPAAYVHPAPNAKTAVPPASAVSWGYSAAEMTQIQAGLIVEVTGRSGFQPAGTSLAAIEIFLQTQCGNRQQALIGLAPSSGTHVVGLNFDTSLNAGDGGWNAAP